MNSGADLDLSGRWTGMFNYPVPAPPVAFETELRDSGGCLAGIVSEPDGTGGALCAVVEGQRQGSVVTFAKIYDDAERRPEPVFYTGTVQPDGNEISGRWEIHGHWSGTFLMVRDSGTDEAVAEAVDEEVSLPGG